MKKKNALADIETQISELLKKKKKNYITVTQLKNTLPASLLKQFGIIKRKSRPTDILRYLKPHLGSSLWEYRSPRSVYIGFRMSSEEIILEKIRKNPGLSSKNLARNLPLLKQEFIPGLNRLLESGEVVCTFGENHMPRLRISAGIGRQTRISEKESFRDGRTAFKIAYDRVGRGQNFVRIHRIRECLNWSGEYFDKTLKNLLADYTVEPHGGDPSTMSEKEIRDSFTDEHGVLYINLTWWGDNDERE